MSKTSRDDFPQSVLQVLAKRAGYKCSNPDCRKPTSGPAFTAGAVNVGVAAHITAAAPGGSRYDASLSARERAASENGIWLCQQCSRLIDADDNAHPVSLLLDWKQFAEAAAFLELRGFNVVKGRSFASLENKIPELIAEMREDLKNNKLTREIIVLSKKWSYNSGSKPFFIYYFEDHNDLLSKLQICENYGAIKDVRFNDIYRYNFAEEFVEYVLATCSTSDSGE